MPLSLPARLSLSWPTLMSFQLNLTLPGCCCIRALLEQKHDQVGQQHVGGCQACDAGNTDRQALALKGSAENLDLCCQQDCSSNTRQQLQDVQLRCTEGRSD
jgi:hypothetical protein